MSQCGCGRVVGGSADAFVLGVWAGGWRSKHGCTSCLLLLVGGGGAHSWFYLLTDVLLLFHFMPCHNATAWPRAARPVRPARSSSSSSSSSSSRAVGGEEAPGRGRGAGGDVGGDFRGHCGGGGGGGWVGGYMGCGVGNEEGGRAAFCFALLFSPQALLLG